MERVRHSGEGEAEPWEELIPEEPLPGLEEYLTSEVVLDLLRMPKDGLIRINAALFFLGDNEMFAYYWRDSQSGKQYCKLLAADAVQAAFHPMPFESGWMPPGTLRFGIDSAGERWISVFVPPACHQLSILDNDLGFQQIEVPLPGFVFTGLGRSYWIWAVKDTRVSPETELYHAPLSNVGTNGSICFGANQTPVADETSILPALHLFLESPFNGHLASAKSQIHKGDIRFRLQELAQQKVAHFPNSELCPLVTQRQPAHPVTLEMLLNAIIRQRR